MGVEAVFVPERIVSPQCFTKRIDGNDLSRIAGKRFQQQVLFGCQGNDLAALVNFSPAEINGTPIQNQQRGVLLVGPAQNGIDTQ